MGNIKVLVVDDSAVVRNILVNGFAKFPDLTVIGAAPDPYIARDIIVRNKPDVITLDIEMPRMDGLEFIGVLMEHMPIPIVIVSSLVDGKCETSLRALELGAVDVFAKPTSDVSRKLPNLILDLVEKVRAASNCRLIRKKPGEKAPGQLSALTRTTDKVIAIGASTGGTEAIKDVLQRLPKGMPGILIVQHMPEHFTRAFANRLDSLCDNVEVKEAVNGDSVHPGKVLIAPGNCHMLLRRSGARYYAEVKDGPLVCRHKPSVEVLFNSMAEIAGRNAVGVMLTGMGKDGAGGMLKMRQAGARTIAQSEKSCVVYGMPREAIELGAVEKISDLDDIPAMIMEML